MRKSIVLLCLAGSLVPTSPVSAAPADQRRSGSPTAKASRAPLIESRVLLQKRFRGPRIPRSFLGISAEYGQLRGSLTRGGVPNVPLYTLLNRLSAEGQGPPVVRIGGGSSEGAWWNPTFEPRPLGINDDLDVEQMQGLRDLLVATKGKAIMTLNLGMNDPGLAVNEARAFVEHLGRDRLLAFELGNEPSIFPHRIHYTDANGETVMTRPQGWGPKDYLREVRALSAALVKAGIDVPQAGPDNGFDPKWVPKRIPDLERALGRRLGLVTVHDYGVRGCKAPGLRDVPWFELLAEYPVLNGARRMQEAIAVTRKARRGLKVRLTETNSADCGGIDNGSNTLTGALWGIDHMFAQAAVGSTGLNFHSSSPRYYPFGFRIQQGRYLGGVAPLYYGMQVFAEATANRPYLLASTYLTRRKKTRNVITTWGLHDRVRDEVRIVTVYKSGRRAGNVDLNVPRGARKAELKRLDAPSVEERRDIRWGGRTYAFPTTDGEMIGESEVERVKRGKRSRYRFRMTPGSATMLTVKLR